MIEENQNNLPTGKPTMSAKSRSHSNSDAESIHSHQSTPGSRKSANLKSQNSSNPQFLNKIIQISLIILSVRI